MIPSVEQAETKEKLIKAKHLYAFISQVNQKIVRLKDEVTLFSNACNLAVEFGKFKMAWIGIIDTKEKKITLIDQSGIPEKEIGLFFNRSYEDNGPQDYVIQSGTYYICNNIEHTHELKNWKPFAKKYNIRSLIVLPINKAGIIIGTLNLYSTETDFSESEEIKLLVEAANDISFALDMFAKEKRYKESEEQLKKSEQFSRGILNSLSSHIAVVDKNGTILTVNDKWKEFAFANGETTLLSNGVGSNYFSVCEKSAKTGITKAAEVLEGMKDVMTGKIPDFNMEYPCHSPLVKRWFAMRVMKFEDKEPMVVVAHLNITEQKLAKIDLRKSETLLKEAQETAHMGNWEIDMITNTHFWSDGFYKIYGITKENVLPSSETFLSYMHPDDSVFAAKEIEKTFETHIPSCINFRFIRNDGRIRHGYTEWKFEFDHDNKPLRIFGIVQDVTERKETEQKLIYSEKHNRALIENITDAIILVSEKSEIIYQSTSAERIGGFSLADMAGKNVFDFLHPDDAESCVSFFLQALTNPGVPMQNQYRILHKQGHYIWIEGTIVNLLQDENVNAYIINYRDITERKLTQQKLDSTLLELEQRVEDRTKDLSFKNKSITDSINYAKRIQVGLLSPNSLLYELFPQSFIFSHPRDIVSGDFFWCYEKNNKKFIVLADCTGHGVPGALMSIIGNNLLNTIIIDNHIDNPSEILQQLDIQLKQAVKGDKGEIKDGMDIALCVLDSYFNEVYYAGAYRPLFISDENGMIQELEATRNSIGGGIREEKKRFETKRFPIFPGQRIYLTSDGYYSQFGGAEDKKYMKSRFKKTLENIQVLPMSEQKKMLKEALTDWAGSTEQVDDVLVIGIEL